MSAANALLSGLVPISTSQTEPAVALRDGIEVDTILGRWKRLRKAVRLSSRFHAVSERGRLVMVTLTYRDTDQQSPKDIARFLDCVRKWSYRDRFHLRYVWVGEMQGRGALHYHIGMFLPSRIYMPCPDKLGWWPHGSSNVKPMRDAVGYMTKYLSKVRSKLGEGVCFPKGYRMHGTGGLDHEQREQRAYELAPQWVQELGGVELRFRRARGGGFFSKATGEHWPSPWELVSIRKRLGIGAIVKIRLKSLTELEHVN